VRPIGLDGEDLLTRVRALEPTIRAFEQQIEQGTATLPGPIVEALVECGVFRTHAPRAIGGLEVDVLTFFEVVEELSRVNGSVGWLAMINCGNFFSWFEPKLALEMFQAAQPYAVFSGNLAPKGRAVVTSGGYRVTGQWSFVSGCPHADWILLRAPVHDADGPRQGPDGLPEVISVALPAANIQILPTWNGLGLRGTGSHDVAVSDVFVPQAHCSTLEDFYPGPLYKAWFFLLGHAAHALGIARAAIQALIDQSRAPGSPRAGALASRAEVQSALAEAEALVQAARQFVCGIAVQAYDQGAQEGAISNDLRMLLKLSMTHAVHSVARAVELVYRAAGPPSVYYGAVLERCFRDVHTATQHSLMQAVHYQPIGQYLFTRDLPGGPLVTTGRAII
jgi:alkylation response protein AidB-like acyl-CoA dehydrogenase